MTKARLYQTIATIAGLFVFLSTQKTEAFTFRVYPLQMILSASSSSGLLTLENESDERVRFQVTVFAWDEDQKGEMILSETNDLIFYPTLLTLGAKEKRNIRVGTRSPQVTTEKSYRIFVEELPPATKPTGPGIRVLTKMGIPVFIQPGQLKKSVHIEQLAVRGDQLSFDIKNQGNVHIVPRDVQVTGVNARGEPLTKLELRHWYVLAGHSRRYEVTLPKTECTSIKDFVVQLQVEGQVMKETVAMHPDSCPR